MGQVSSLFHDTALSVYITITNIPFPEDFNLQSSWARDKRSYAHLVTLLSLSLSRGSS